VRFCPSAADVIAEAGSVAELHFRVAPQPPVSASARLHNWQSILWIVARVSDEEVDADECTLVVAKDAAILSGVLHRLASVLALSVSCRPSADLGAPSLSALSSHPAVEIICASAERRLNVASSLVQRLMLQEPEKFVYTLSNPSKLPANPDAASHDGATAVEEFLRDMYVRSSDLVDALRHDGSAFRLVLWALSRGLLAKQRVTVVCAARAVGAVGNGYGGHKVSEWLFSSGGRSTGGRAGQGTGLDRGHGWMGEADGLDAMLAALHAHRGDADVADAVGAALVKCVGAGAVPSLLSAELILRGRRSRLAAEGGGGGAGAAWLEGYCRVTADLLPVLASDAKAAHEMEWSGCVPFIIDLVLRELRGGGVGEGDGGGSRQAAMRLLVVAWRAFPRALIASDHLVSDLFSGLSASLAPLRLGGGGGAGGGVAGGGGIGVYASSFRGACDLLLILIEQKCSAAGQLYR